MRERHVYVVGGLTIDALPTTCPRCGRGTGEYCGHFARLVRAVRERLARESDRAEREKLAELLAEMDRNRAAIAASGPWDIANAQQGHATMPGWRQSPRLHVRHVSGDHP